MTAISAVDLAIWDVLGKAAKQPVFKLLGGRTKPKIPVYASRLYSQPLDKLAAEAKTYKDAGLPGDEAALRLGPEGRRRRACSTTSISCARCAKPSATASTSWPTPTWAGRSNTRAGWCRCSSRFNLRWLEEPVIPDDLHGYAALKALGRIPIAGGEHEYTQSRLPRSARGTAVDYIQFDTNRVGGITQARKISALAESFAVPVVPHAGQMHNYHVVDVQPELARSRSTFRRSTSKSATSCSGTSSRASRRPVNGHINLSDDVPGLGLTIKADALAKFSVIE